MSCSICARSILMFWKLGMVVWGAMWGREKMGENYVPECAAAKTRWNVQI